MMVTGSNGVGKTAVARILAGLWPLFDGVLEKPPVSYTHLRALESGRTDEDLMEILRRVHLAYLPDREGGWTTRKEWKDVLSGGEKQRMGMARLFYHHPSFAVLDECTSAVSTDVEGLMYAHAKDMGITLITISHRPSLFKYHQLLLDMKGDDKYEVINLAGDEQKLTIEQELTDLRSKLEQVQAWKQRLHAIHQELSFSHS